MVFEVQPAESFPPFERIDESFAVTITFPTTFLLNQLTPLKFLKVKKKEQFETSEAMKNVEIKRKLLST
ncbi:CLUMA_CG005906, isoform A [Clunio marinus]|uniref:CLUMA_CG005906, isoform A n=1 Tax=Clunio marinus TaxID=568069 RepID=A0A1J1HW58_9DIPT|nr:CLUMA_CG005906, isoform A [Clunio marinus]